MSISLASIIAKVERDNYITKLFGNYQLTLLVTYTEIKNNNLETLTISRTFDIGNKQQELSLIDTLKIACRKFSKERTGKKPFTNINLVRI